MWTGCPCLGKRGKGGRTGLPACTTQAAECVDKVNAGFKIQITVACVRHLTKIQNQKGTRKKKQNQKGLRGSSTGSGGVL